MTISDALQSFKRGGELFESLQAIADLLRERWYPEWPCESCPWPVRAYQLVWNALGEIESGSIAAFFYSGCGPLAEETVRALRDVGATRKADALQQAMDSFPDGRYPRSTDEYDDMFDDIQDPDILPEDLDDLFIHESEEVEPLLLAYVYRYRDQFPA
jgi:hypothetical protein